MMKHVLGISADFSNALQSKDQDIVNTLSLLQTTLRLLSDMRDSGSVSLLDETQMFRSSREIPVLYINEHYQRRGRRNADSEMSTNDYHYRVQIFLAVIDEQIAEFKHRFPTETVKVLQLSVALDPRENFKDFSKQHLIELAKLYSDDFNGWEIDLLEIQLSHFILDVRQGSCSKE